MRRPPRIALFAHASPHFVMVLDGLRRGFAALGCETHMGWPPLDGRMLDAFRRNFRPDIILEVNRTRNALEDDPGSFLHVAWIEGGRYDTRWLSRDLSGSDRLYFMAPPDLFGVDGFIGQEWDYLWPGTDPEIFHPEPTVRRWDCSLVGHLYGPPSTTAAAAPVVVGGVERGTFGDLLSSAAGWSIERNTRSYKAVIENVAGYYRGRGADLSPDDIRDEVLHIVDEYIPRTASRVRLAETMLEISDDTRFFGNPAWLLWPRLARHYGGEIRDPALLAGVYRASALNMHVALCPWHFRTIDCMGAGGVILVNRTRHPDPRASLDADFTEGLHYVEYGDDDLADKARMLLRDPARRAAIGEAAARRVAERHTWRHRAAQILRDLEWSI